MKQLRAFSSICTTAQLSAIIDTFLLRSRACLSDSLRQTQERRCNLISDCAIPVLQPCGRRRRPLQEVQACGRLRCWEGRGFLFPAPWRSGQSQQVGALIPLCAHLTNLHEIQPTYYPAPCSQQSLRKDTTLWICLYWCPIGSHCMSSHNCAACTQYHKEVTGDRAGNIWESCKECGGLLHLCMHA